MSREIEYQFEADRAAASRLDRMSQIFAPTMGALVEALPARDWATVLDLGCGAGASTRCLQQQIRPDRIVGVDASEEHLRRALEMGLSAAEFECGDVVEMDLGGYHADLIYVRFLLAYLDDTAHVLDRWRTQLAAGGLLAIEESLGNESVEPVFQDYFELVRDVAKTQGTCFYGGRKLVDLAVDDVMLSRDFRLSVPGEIAAEMFLGNMPLWQADPWVQENWGARLVGLRDGLLDAMQTGSAEPVVWTLRQMLMGARRVE
jgi:ubiquinone/menaquinone biosynthesis C-methylase UbiE